MKVVKKINFKIVLLLIIFCSVLYGGYCIINKIFFDKENENLINILDLSDEFMNNYFEEYNNLDKEDKDNMLIVISSEVIDAEDYGAKIVLETPNNKYYLLFEDDVSKENARQKLVNEDDVVSIEDNIVREAFVDNEETYNSWGVQATGLNYASTTISSMETKNDVVVAIIDTGLDVNLFNKYYSGRLEGKYNVLDSSDNMYDNFGHGTHIAGTIAESTPNNVKIYPIKITDDSSMFETDIIAAIEYVIYYTDATVINMSFGGSTYSDAEYQAIEAAKERNIISVVAAGNDNTSQAFYPAAFDNTISIASVDSSFNKSTFSNYGSTIDFAAPGTNIKSILASYMELSSNTDGDADHETISGTSMATPHAASAVAILKSINDDITLTDTKNLLKTNAIDLGSKGFDIYYGYGLINFTNAKFCIGNELTCDSLNVFKLITPTNMSVNEVAYTSYNYGSLSNIMDSIVSFEEADGYDYTKKLWELDGLTITGYDPYASGEQTVTIQYSGLEASFKVTNPDNYESGWEYQLFNDKYYLTGYKDNNLKFYKLYLPEKIDDHTISGIVNFSDKNSNLFSNSTDAKNFTEIIIPNSIKNVGDYAFSGLPYVNKVYILGSSVIIGESAFSDMPSLTTIDGDITLTDDKINVFKNDISLKNVSISDETLIIPVGTFVGCNLLSDITIPGSVEKIDDFAFLNSGISNIDFSEGLKEIGVETFEKTEISEITLPNSLEKIGNYAFFETNITTIRIPKNVNSIGLAPFSGNLIETIVVDSENTYYDSRNNSNLIIETSTNKIIQGSIDSTIPSSILIIGEESYSNLNKQTVGFELIDDSELFTSLEITNGVTTIEKNAFLNSENLKKVVLPESINYIDSSVFVNGTSGLNTPFQQTVLWVHDSSYAHNYAIENNITYLNIENFSNSKDIGGFVASFESRTYYPNETVDVEWLKYYYWSTENNGVEEVEIEDYTIKYQNGDSLKYGDNKFFFVFDMENMYQNVKIGYDILVEKEIPTIPTINLLIGERILDIITVKENGFGINIDGGILYFDDLNSFDEAGDYTVGGNFIATDSKYDDIWGLNISIHVINKRYVKNEVSIYTKISDGTTNIDKSTITLSGVDKSNYTIVSAYLESADYIGNNAKATVKIRLNDEFYENYAFSGDKQELELVTTMSVVNITIPEINLLKGENFWGKDLDDGWLRGYNNSSFDTAGDYTIIGYYKPNGTVNSYENIPIPIHVIDKNFVEQWVEIPNKVYDGTTNLDLNTIELPGLDKSLYTVLSAVLVSPDVDRMASAIVKVKLTDEAYDNYAFTNNVQELEWWNPITVVKATPSYEVPSNLKGEIGQNLYDIELPTGFTWTSTNVELNELGNKKFMAKFTPTDTNNYNVVEDIEINVLVVNHKEEIIPSITISDKTYDGTTNIDESTITVSNLNTSDYTVESVTIPDANVGSKIATIKLKLTDEKYETAEFEGQKQEKEFSVNMNVVYKLITKPSKSDNTYTYTGSEITFDITGYDESSMNITGNKGTNVGTYEVTIALKNNNFLWEDGKNDVITLTYKIVKADLFVVDTSTDVTINYDGHSHSINTSFEYDDGTIIRYMDDNGEYTLENVPQYTNVGTYVTKYKWYLDDNHTEYYNERTITINTGTFTNNTLDYEGVYDGHLHTITINVDLTDYNIYYSVNNRKYDLNELPAFTDIGEHIINYKIIKNGYEDLEGSNKVKIYGFKGFDSSIIVKNNNVVVENNSFNELKNKVNTYSKTTTFTHLDSIGKTVTYDSVKTGDVIKININGTNDYNYTISYLGDVNGDGNIGIIDYIRIMKDIMNTTKLSGIYYEAADMNRNNKIDIIDYIRIMKIIMEEK